MNRPNDLSTLEVLIAHCADGAHIFEAAGEFADRPRARLLLAQLRDKHRDAANTLAHRVRKEIANTRAVRSGCKAAQHLSRGLESGTYRAQPLALFEDLERFETCCLDRMAAAMRQEIPGPVRDAVAFEHARLTHAREALRWIARDMERGARTADDRW